MSAKTVADLVVSVETEARDAVRGFEVVGDSSKTMADTVGQSAEATRRSLGITADAADDLGGKAGKATGALGALSSGFELLGPSGSAAATGLQSAALATDFLSGVGDSLNLVMESTIVKNIRQRAVTLATAAASGFAAVKTGVLTAAQWALNAALDANPIGLIVLAIAALAAGFVLAYKKSETFRTVVNFVVTAVIGYFKLVTLPIRTLIGFIADLVEKIPGVGAAFRQLRDVAKTVGDAILAPFKAVGDAIQHIIDLIGKIHIPKLPHIPGLGRVAVGDTGTDTGSGITNIFNITGLLDSPDLVSKLENLFAREGRRVVFS